MSIEATINAGWDARDTVSAATQGELRTAVNQALAALDAGELRVAEPDGAGGWRVNQWLKKAVLLSFRLNDSAVIPGPGGTNWYDKVPSKFEGWGENRFRDAGFRAVPGAIVRHGAYIAPGAILMPSFVNIGARVGKGTMVDTWATVGSCAQIGEGVHLSGGAGIGGVLEPLQAGPVIIGDGAFIGARAEVAEGVQRRRRRRALDGRLPRRLHQDRRSRHRRSPYRQGAALRCRRFRHHARQAAARWLPRPRPLLRGHRQDRRRPDAQQDRHQRAAAGLTGGSDRVSNRASRRGTTRTMAAMRMPITGSAKSSMRTLASPIWV